jgi:hypothetical protein
MTSDFPVCSYNPAYNQSCQLSSCRAYTLANKSIQAVEKGEKRGEKGERNEPATLGKEFQPLMHTLYFYSWYYCMFLPILCFPLSHASMIFWTG